ncbi:hypothetical protein E2562_008916 [Oryza meyeriana var. granulata]|uniref:Uncharacterized protein n=1 Tax=Oryza meyeriana var. granulata TaxID=110450 RepID=A0A6G1CZK1_9ORYZ|nr:hypothetical protein E2562_008916 [Oryza meyeriana var. granulata]
MANTNDVEKDRTVLVPLAFAVADDVFRKRRGAGWNAWPFVWYVALVTARSPFGVTAARPSMVRFSAAKPWWANRPSLAGWAAALR